MKYTLMISIFILIGCSNEAIRPQNHSFNCQKLTDEIGALIVNKWAVREASKSELDSKFGGWRMLGFLHSKPFQNLGYSIDEVKELAKSVYETDLGFTLEQEHFAYMNLFEKKCTTNKQLKSYNFNLIEESIMGCWSQAVGSKSCVQNIISENVL